MQLNTVRNSTKDVRGSSYGAPQWRWELPPPKPLLELWTCTQMNGNRVAGQSQRTKGPFSPGQSFSEEQGLGSAGLRENSLTCLPSLSGRPDAWNQLQVRVPARYQKGAGLGRLRTALFRAQRTLGGFCSRSAPRPGTERLSADAVHTNGPMNGHILILHQGKMQPYCSLDQTLIRQIFLLYLSHSRCKINFNFSKHLFPFNHKNVFVIYFSTTLGG